MNLKCFMPVPYTINGITLWAVEGSNHWIDRYCDSKEEAQKHCDRLNRPNNDE